MAKRQLLPSSPEKKRQKEPVNETLRAMVADELKLQFGVVREIFKEEFLPIAERIGSLEKEMRLISNNFDNVQTAVRKVKQDSAEVKLIVDTLQDKMAKLEDKSRQCNIRLVGLAEGEEGSDALGNAILNGARAAGQILHKGNSLLFFPDYSNQTAMKRREMNQSRKRLTQLGISSFLIYPATIKVTHRGSTSLLQTPTDVEVYIDQQQELATPQPLGDSTLAGMLTDASA
ncbi:hypothetical protein QQF64_034238 [Cirrhinus molitorella]|uniref:Uncharacterized protein n=1 Tax=Cirrhinus molitorella TaxID=172907 RepID=A0ABR3MW96_9TELE